MMPNRRVLLFKAANHRGVMVALRVPLAAARNLAIEGGEPPSDLHVTLAYLGDADEMDPDVLQSLHDRLSAIALVTPPVEGAVNGLGRFRGPEEDVLYASYDAPDLPALRHRVVEAVMEAGAELAGEHGFTPHITIAYGEPGEGVEMDDLPPLPMPLRFEWLSLVWAGTESQMRLQGDPSSPGDEAPQETLPAETFSELMRASTNYRTPQELEDWAGGAAFGVRPLVAGPRCVAVKKGRAVRLAVEGLDEVEVRADDLIAGLARVPHDFIVVGTLLAREMDGLWVDPRDGALDAKVIAKLILVADDLPVFDGDMAGRPYRERYEMLRAGLAAAGGAVIVPPVVWAPAGRMSSVVSWTPRDGAGPSFPKIGIAATLASSGYTWGPTGDMAEMLFMNPDMFQKLERARKMGHPAVKHLPGQHDQESHGDRDGIAADIAVWQPLMDEHNAIQNLDRERKGLAGDHAFRAYVRRLRDLRFSVGRFYDEWPGPHAGIVGENLENADRELDNLDDLRLVEGGHITAADSALSWLHDAISKLKAGIKKQSFGAGPVVETPGKPPGDAKSKPNFPTTKEYREEDHPRDKEGQWAESGAGKDFEDAGRKMTEGPPLPNGRNTFFNPENGGLLVHGTNIAFTRVTSPELYLTDSYEEAKGYAFGLHLGGGIGKTPMVRTVEARPGRTLAAQREIDDVVENGDLSDMNTIMERARKAGYRYVTFTHPAFHGDREQFVLVSLHPNEDLRFTGGWRVKSKTEIAGTGDYFSVSPAISDIPPGRKKKPEDKVD